MYHQFKELADVDITAGADGDRPDLPLRDGRRRGRRRHPGERGHRACTPSASAPAACTAPTGSAATRSATCWSSASGPARPPRRTPPRSATRARRSTEADVDGRAGEPRWRRSSVEGGREPLHDPARPPAVDERPGRHHPHRRRARASRWRRSRSSRSGRSTMVVEGHRQYNPGWHLAARPAQHAAGLGVRSRRRRWRARSRAAATPATTSRRPTRGVGHQEPRRQARRRRHRRRPAPSKPLPGDARRAQEATSTEERADMGYDLKMRVWRGDDDGGELGDYTVEVVRGRGRPRRDPPGAGHPGRRPRDPLELQGRQVRLVQRRDQRPAAAAVHDPALGLRARPRPSRSRRCAPSR